MFTAVAKSLKELSDQSTARPGYEAVQDVIFDTALYAAAGSATLPYFTVNRNDDSLSNLNGSGTLPAPQFFEPKFIGADFFVQPFARAAATSAGPANDLLNLIFSFRPTITFTYNNKPYLDRVPLSFLHTSNSINSSLAGTYAAPAGTEIATPSTPFAHYSLDGAFTIAPQVQFKGVITWGASAAVNQAAGINVRLWLWGIRQRPVV